MQRATIRAIAHRIDVNPKSNELKTAFLKLVETAGKAPDSFAEMTLSLPDDSVARYVNGKSGFSLPNGEPFRTRLGTAMAIVSCSTFGPESEFAVIQFEIAPGGTLKFAKYRKEDELLRDGFQDLLAIYEADRSKLSMIPRAKNHHVDVKSCVPDGVPDSE